MSPVRTGRQDHKGLPDCAVPRESKVPQARSVSPDLKVLPVRLRSFRVPRAHKVQTGHRGRLVLREPRVSKDRQVRKVHRASPVLMRLGPREVPVLRVPRVFRVSRESRAQQGHKVSPDRTELLDLRVFRARLAHRGPPAPKAFKVQLESRVPRVFKERSDPLEPWVLLAPKVYKAQQDNRDPRARSAQPALKVYRVLPVLRVYKDLLAFRAQPAYGVQLVYKAQPESRASRELLVFRAHRV